MVPASAVVVDKIIRGEIKAGAAVRGNLALRVLELAAKPQQPAGAVPAGVAAALTAIGRALGARAAVTIDAERAEVVNPSEA